MHELRHFGSRPWLEKVNGNACHLTLISIDTNSGQLCWWNGMWLENFNMFHYGSNDFNFDWGKCRPNGIWWEGWKWLVNQIEEVKYTGIRWWGKKGVSVSIVNAMFGRLYRFVCTIHVAYHHYHHLHWTFMNRFGANYQNTTTVSHTYKQCEQ